MSTSSGTKWWLSGLLIIALFAGSALLVLRMTRVSQVPFGPAAWAEASEKARYPLALALLRDQTLPGLALEEVRELLGPPDEQDVSVWFYQLKGRFLYSELTLEWSDGERVATARIDI